MMVLAMFDEYAPKGTKLSSSEMRIQNNKLRKALRWVLIELFNVQVNCCFDMHAAGNITLGNLGSSLSSLLNLDMARRSSFCLGHKNSFWLLRSLSHFA